MHGTTADKVRRLAWHLATHPRDWVRYVATSPWLGHSPVSLGLPWISFGAIDFLEGWLQGHMAAFEWGSGGSTLFLASRVRALTSIEDDPGWADAVRGALAKRGSGNAELRLLPIATPEGPEAGERRYVDAVRQGRWDLILVDGVVDFGRDGVFGTLRPQCFRAAEDSIRPGGIIVVDDIWMFPEITRSNRALSSREFTGVGPCRLGVTSTGMFFY